MAQKQPPFKECVTAHWSRIVAPKILGAKHNTEARGRSNTIGRGALYKRLSNVERRCGLYTSENVGMSNEKYARIILTESPRVPGEG